MSVKDHNRLAALAFCRADLLFELNDQWNIEFAAGATPALLGQEPDALIDTSFMDLISERDRSLCEQLLSIASDKGRIDDVIVTLNGKGGYAPIVAFSGYRVPDFKNHFFLALKVEPAHANYTAESDLVCDTETGLLDEKSFSGTAAERAQALLRAGGKARLSMIRIENLGTLMEQLGTSEKKDLMESIGGILNSKSLGGNTASRVDGENFSIVHSDDVDVEDIGEAIEKKAKQVHADGNMISSMCSTLDADGSGMSQDQTAKAVIYIMRKFCDSKGGVRNESLAQVLSSMMAKTTENVAYLRAVAKSGEFDLVFMPICELRKGFIEHFEALIRFNRAKPTESPYPLIELAEETGVINVLDIAVCHKAIKLIKKFSQKENFPPVAINISGASIVQPEFVEELYGIVGKEPDLADKMMFEITESSTIDDVEAVNAATRKIRDLGFKFCLDDFGAGASSFSYLSQLDVDVVKFDGPIVRRACSTDKGNDVLLGMVKMCDEMNIWTIAEKVETQKDANHLFYLGVSYGQGHFFGEPVLDPFEYADKFQNRLIRHKS